MYSELSFFNFSYKINLDSKWDEYKVMVNNHSNYEYSDDEDLHVLTSEKQLFGEWGLFFQMELSFEYVIMR